MVPALKFLFITLKKRKGLEHLVHGCGLLGTIGVLQDAGNASANDFGHRGTKAGHRDTVCVDTTKPDMRTVGPGAKSLRSADPREGVRVDQRREHDSPFSPRCTKMGMIQAGTLNFFPVEQSVAARLLPK